MPDRGHLGVTSLLAGGIIPWPTGFVHWWTWWIGDTIGALVVIPLLLVWTQHRARSGAAASSPWCCHSGSPSCSWSSLCMRGPWNRHACSSTLSGGRTHWPTPYGRALTATSMRCMPSRASTPVPEVSRPAFRTFVQRLFVRYPGIQALSWDRRVPDMERNAYEAAMRQAGYPAFQITEQNAQGQLVRAAARQEYMAVTYIEPSAGNESALGYDVASETDRLMALHSARDTGTPRATGRLMLVQETSQQHGLLIFLPLYSSGLPPTRWRHAAITCTAM